MMAIKSMKTEVKDEIKVEMEPIKSSIINLENQMQNLNLKVEEKFQSLNKKIDLNDIRV